MKVESVVEIRSEEMSAVRLRAVEERDLPDFVRWLNDAEVTYFLTHEIPEATLETELDWLARKRAPECRDRVFAIEAEGRSIGVCELHAEEMGPTAAFGIIIGDKSAWGKGYGTAATREAVRIGFEEMGLERIWLTASSVNPRGVRCYEKVGFQHEGVLRRARLKRGEWIDVINMGLLRTEWEELTRSRDGIGTFCLSEYEEIAALWQAAGLPPRPSDTKEEVAKKLRRDPDLFLVARQAGQLVGSVIGGWDGRRGWVYRMAVRPDFQRRGIGTALMRELERRLRAKGAIAINLIYNRKNERAFEFYTRLGYDTRGTEGAMGKSLSDG